MSSNRIVVDVDDTAIDMALAKMKQYMATAQVALGTPNVSAGLQAATTVTKGATVTLTPVTSQLELLRIRMASLGLQNLPSLNRELRIAINTVPGMNRYTRALFNIKRLGRGFAGDDLQLGLSLLVVAIMLMRFAQSYIQDLERQKRNYERFIREERGLTHDQYNNLMTEWQGVFRSRPG